MSVSALTSGFVGVLVGAIAPVALSVYQDRRTNSRWKIDVVDRAFGFLTGGTQQRSMGLASLELMIRGHLLPHHSKQVVGRALWNQFQYLEEEYHLDERSPSPSDSTIDRALETPSIKTPKAHEIDNILHLVDLLSDDTSWHLDVDKLGNQVQARLHHAQCVLNASRRP
jgi:hypothetical protein